MYIYIYILYIYIYIYIYVTKFAKRGLIHASNFSNLWLCNSACG